MARRGRIARIPLWIRVAGIITVVLVGIVVGALLLDTPWDGDGHGPDDRNQPSDHRPGGDRDPGGHGGDHNTGVPEQQGGRDR